MKHIFTKIFILLALLGSEQIFAQTLPVLPSPNFNTDHDAFVIGEIKVTGSTQKIAGVIAKLSRVVSGATTTYVPVSYAMSDANGMFRLTGQAGVNYRIEYEFPTAGFTAVNPGPSEPFVVSAGDNQAPNGGFELARIENTITNCNALPPALTDWNATFNVDKAVSLNSSAKLNSVTVFGSAIAAHPVIEVSATTASNVRALTIGAGIVLVGPGEYLNGLDAVKNFAGPLSSQNLVLSAGQTLTYYDISSAKTSNFTFYTIPDEYTGTGQVEFYSEASGSKTITTTGGNTTSMEQTLAGSGVCLTYTYTIDPMPVTLSSFNATAHSEAGATQVSLDWTTTSETNSEYFEVQRSGDTKRWASVGIIPSNKESNVLRTYALTDPNPLSGTSYYRLKMVDADETFAYSSIKSVKVRAEQLVTLYPNPATKVMYVAQNLLANVAKITLVDQSARILYTTNSKPEMANGVNISQFKTGIYMVKMDFTDGTTRIQKMVFKN